MANKTDLRLQNKAALLSRAADLHSAANAVRAWRGLCVEDAVLHLPHPFAELAGVSAICDNFWKPFVRAFPNAERRCDILLAGEIKRREYTCAAGRYLAAFAADYLGIPASGGAVELRFAEFRRIKADARADRVFLFLDFPDLMRQAGVWPLSPPLGAEGFFPPPQNGVIVDAPDSAESLKTKELTRAMLTGLSEYRGDLESLASMGQKRFWHPQMMWFGPAAVGTTRGLRGFEDFHQRPFLRAFPDRRGAESAPCIAENAYAASFGWPAMRATHKGGGWLGLPPCGRKLTMRVADFWRRENDMLRDNWVFIDIPDILFQMGLDIFARLRIRRK